MTKVEGGEIWRSRDGLCGGYVEGGSGEGRAKDLERSVGRRGEG